jgi:hypothetical protein
VHLMLLGRSPVHALYLRGQVASVVVTVRIALVGDENDAYPSHRELNAVRRMLGDDVVAEWWRPTDHGLRTSPP